MNTVRDLLSLNCPIRHTNDPNSNYLHLQAKIAPTHRIALNQLKCKWKFAVPCTVNKIYGQQFSLIEFLKLRQLNEIKPIQFRFYNLFAQRRGGTAIIDLIRYISIYSSQFTFPFVSEWYFKVCLAEFE